MRSRVQRWGNSLAVRIPRSFAAETNIEEGTLVELSLAQGALMVSPIDEPVPTLEELLAGVTDENIHGEWDTGPAVGKEIW
jgi:antitoxin MazE